MGQAHPSGASEDGSTDRVQIAAGAPEGGRVDRGAEDRRRGQPDDAGDGGDAASSRARPMVRLAAPLRVVDAHRSPSVVKGARQRALLAELVCAAVLFDEQRAFTPAELIRTLWPSHDPAGAGAVHVAVRRLRVALSTSIGCAPLVSSVEGYRWDLTVCDCDLRQLVSIAAAAQREYRLDRLGAAARLCRDAIERGYGETELDPLTSRTTVGRRARRLHQNIVRALRAGAAEYDTGDGGPAGAATSLRLLGSLALPATADRAGAGTYAQTHRPPKSETDGDRGRNVASAAARTADTPDVGQPLPHTAAVTRPVWEALLVAADDAAGSGDPAKASYFCTTALAALDTDDAVRPEFLVRLGECHHHLGSQDVSALREALSASGVSTDGASMNTVTTSGSDHIASPAPPSAPLRADIASRALAALARSDWFFNSRRNDHLLRHARDLAETTPTNPHTIAAWDTLASLHASFGETGSAVHAADRALTGARRIQVPGRVASALATRAVAHHLSGRFDSAMSDIDAARRTWQDSIGRIPLGVEYNHLNLIADMRGTVAARKKYAQIMRTASTARSPVTAPLRWIRIDFTACLRAQLPLATVTERARRLLDTGGSGIHSLDATLWRARAIGLDLTGDGRAGYECAQRAWDLTRNRPAALDYQGALAVATCLAHRVGRRTEATELAQQLHHSVCVHGVRESGGAYTPLALTVLGQPAIPVQDGEATPWRRATDAVLARTPQAAASMYRSVGAETAAATLERRIQ